MFHFVNKGEGLFGYAFGTVEFHQVAFSGDDLEPEDNGLGLAFDFLGLYHSNCLLIPDTKVRLYFQIK